MLKAIQDPSNVRPTEQDILLNFKTFEEFSENFLDIDRKRNKGNTHWLSQSLIYCTEVDSFHMTAEYVLLNKMLSSSIKKPRDLFRERDKFTLGYTIDRSRNTQVKENVENGRFDYIFAFDSNTDSDFSLLKLNCAECSVESTSGNA